MTILDAIQAPRKPRDEALTDLIDRTGQSVTMLTLDELASKAAHEYDEEVVVPVPGSAGERFLRDVAATFVRWISREERFPGIEDVTEVAGLAWHRDQAAAEPVSAFAVAQAYVDLGLFYSHHCDVARGAGVEDFKRVLDEAAEALIFTLAEEYGPLV